jgi:hypothetical protein
MNKHKMGLVLGSFVAFVHIVWSVLIAFGWAQPWMDFVLRMHSLNNPYFLLPFDLTRSLGLIILTFLVGYILGNIFAMIWNKLHR